jgi:hypothetical protein
LRDVFLEDLGLGCLRVTKVHHLIKKLVNDDEVVPNGFFFEGLEILGKDLDNLVKKEKNFGGVCVSFC